jgi:hypothetical protein
VLSRRNATLTILNGVIHVTRHETQLVVVMITFPFVVHTAFSSLKHSNMPLDYVRTLVSGKKARFVDSENAINLDLVYGEPSLCISIRLCALILVTDRIIMFA